MVNEKIKAAEENVIHVYNRFPIALERGEGVYLYDTNGKKYLDFAAGFAVSGLGYGNQKLNAALKFQIDQLYQPVLSYQLWRGSPKTEPDFGDGSGIFYEQWG